MIEPTETEDKEMLELFAGAMLDIAAKPPRTGRRHRLTPNLAGRPHGRTHSRPPTRHRLPRRRNKLTGPDCPSPTGLCPRPGGPVAPLRPIGRIGRIGPIGPIGPMGPFCPCSSVQVRVRPCRGAMHNQARELGWSMDGTSSGPGTACFFVRFYLIVSPVLVLVISPLEVAPVR